MFVSNTYLALKKVLFKSLRNCKRRNKGNYVTCIQGGYKKKSG